jgi:penicillin amidase
LRALPVLLGAAFVATTCGGGGGGSSAPPGAGPLAFVADPALALTTSVWSVGSTAIVEFEGGLAPLSFAVSDPAVASVQAAGPGAAAVAGLAPGEFVLRVVDASGAEIESGALLVEPAVSTTRDARGVWFVRGGTLREAARAQGYAVAEDRLWRLEVFRRSARGELAALFGPDLLASDRERRTRGYTEAQLAEAFESLALDARTLVSGYVEGLNARIAEVLGDPALLPWEFVQKSLEIGAPIAPAPWSTSDVLAWCAVQVRNFDGEAGFASQVENSSMLEGLEAAFGAAPAAAMFADLNWLDDPVAQTVIPDRPAPPEIGQGISAASGVAEAGAPAPLPPPPAPPGAPPGARPRAAGAKIAERLARVRECELAVGARVEAGSYAWVVGPSRSAEGTAILYSGPQVGLTAPAVGHEGSVEGGGLAVAGMGVSGFPLFPVGRTPHHAWALESGHARTTDHYAESPAALVLERIELIEVLGAPSELLPVWKSARGPLVEPLGWNGKELDPQTPLVTWRWSGYGREHELVEVLLGFARALSPGEFGSAAEALCGSLHLFYADRDGHIGYWMSGWAPERPPGIDYRLLLPGDGSADWIEPLAYAPRPSIVDPAQGWLGGWNNRASHLVANSNAPGGLYGPFHRGHVIADALAQSGPLSFEALRALALDIAHTDSQWAGGNLWSVLGEHFAAAVAAYPTPEREAALALIEAWDGHFVPGGPGGWAAAETVADAYVLLRDWTENFLARVFADEKVLGEAHATLVNVVLHALAGAESGVQNQHDWFTDQAAGGQSQDVEIMIVDALDTVLYALGPQPWNQPRGTIDHTHELLSIVWASPEAKRSGFAQIAEYGAGGLLRAETHLPLGQSGWIHSGPLGEAVYSEHFLDQALAWDAWQYASFPPFESQ